MPLLSRTIKELNMRTIKPIYRVFAILLIVIAAMGQIAHATTVTYTYQGNTSSGLNNFIGHFIASGDITGNYPEAGVAWENSTTNELSFDLADGITLTVKNTISYGIQGTGFLGIRGNTTLTVSNSNYYITHIKVYDPKGRIIQFNEAGQQVSSGGVTEFDFYNLEKSYSRDIITSFTFSKIELTYSSTIPLEEAEMTGIPTDPCLPPALGGTNPVPTVTWHGVTLTQDTDYTLSWDNNTTAGTATVTATGAGKFSGTVSANYTLRDANLHHWR